MAAGYDAFFFWRFRHTDLQSHMIAAGLTRGGVTKRQPEHAPQRKHSISFL